MFQRVLIANRGAVACRIIRTLRIMGIESVAIYSEADAGSLHVRQADVAVCVGPAPAAESYLHVDRILKAARDTGAEAIHPGYGFLSENAAFAGACESSGLVFLGPTPTQIRAFGLKNTARELAVENKVPVLPGTGLLLDAVSAADEAAKIGYPVMLKSAGGGGGIGMRRCYSEPELLEGFAAVSRLSETHFKGSGIFLEKFIAKARHIEVQVFGDGRGNVVVLGERDCSVQRRNQKVVEETPAPNISTGVRDELHRVAAALMQSVNYRSAGTVEFLYDAQAERFYFLEVNSRLQVEHAVTEEVWGVDLVEWMVRLGCGDLPPLAGMEFTPTGVSIQVRLYAENPLEDFGPSSGRVTEFVAPSNARCDTWIETGSEVSPFYDPLLAKVIVKGDSRAKAVIAMQRALAETRISGFETNIEFLRTILRDPSFLAANVSTAFLGEMEYSPKKVKVIESGVITTVQQYPGRLGYWAVGVPPSGPMDPLSMRLVNELLGNQESAPTLECTLSGPTLHFFSASRIAVGGADMLPSLNGSKIPLWTPIEIAPGDILQLGNLQDAGARAYIAVDGGFQVPEYLGSATTFTLGNFGGHAGRALRAGDTLTLAEKTLNQLSATPRVDHPPALTHDWKIGALYGPHGAPDFLTSEYLNTFFATSWRVHHNSSRTGVRLIGPKPQWARQDGGDAGLHPSNIHDNAYAVGAIDFTGDMPVILGPDGPSLGGFVCPAVIATAELWKVGQLAPGDSVQFVRISNDEALRLDRTRHDYRLVQDSNDPAILQKSASAGTVTRASGDRYLLIEFGEAKLDLNLRFRAHALMQALEAERLDGIIDLTPGIRSLQIHYDPQRLSREKLLSITGQLSARNPDLDSLVIPSRTVHLPLSWDDPATRLAIERYMSSVRPDAPWCPSNLEFIRRINGLQSIADVQRIVFDANYLVLGLGDVYLGAPVATPVDPRHRLVTTKYNPARTWTPENAVGIGGAYLCVYGMEGPGGYQFVGRTVQMWNTYRTTKNFEKGKPWLLRFFDQIRFYPVEAEGLLEMRQQFPLGRFEVRVEQTQFDLAAYHRFLSSIQTEAASFRQTQQEAFAAERCRWTEQGEFDVAVEEPVATSADNELHIPVGCSVLRAPTTASVWRVQTAAGNSVEAGQRVFILEAMKMEIAVHTSESGEIVELLCQPGALVTAGQPLLIYRP